MKALKLILVFLVISYSSVFAADTTNVVVNFIEQDGWILFYGPATFSQKTSAGTDNSITQWMDISKLDIANNPGEIQLWITNIAGTEDVNGFIQFSNTTTGADFQHLTTDADLDQIQTTVKFDTVGISETIKCNGARYMRLYFDGQTGNPDGASLNWYIFFTKPEKAWNKSIGSVGDYS